MDDQTGPGPRPRMALKHQDECPVIRVDGRQIDTPRKTDNSSFIEQNLEWFQFES